MAARVSSPGQPQRVSTTPNPRKKTQTQGVVAVEASRPIGYASEGVKDNDIFKLPGSDWQLLGTFTVLAAVVRLFRIFQPSSVVFDEVHFGGFASKYIKGTFFMDVHPPLAKMLIALTAWLAGFDGSFDFKDIGKDYLEPGVPYVAMRLFPALCGVLTIPTIFMTLKVSGCRTTTAALGACLVIFENGLLTNNRLILLDSPLIAATAATALAWTCFTNQQELGSSKAFKPTWWFWLVSTGLCLGVTVSMKWVGLFTIAWVGSLTVLQLWVLLGDSINVTPRLWFKHLLARTFCLIVIPIAFYMAMFAIHFVCLSNPGEGDGFMSSEFQATLNGKTMDNVVADVAFGSRISLRHWNTQGGYLHSHASMYPEGSQQQQITLYPHKDENNVWLVENQTQPEGLDGPIVGPSAWDNDKPVLIEDGAIIKLYHRTTHRRLHSHDVRAPVTEADWQQEVSAYGYEGFEGDANDLFRIEIVKSMSDGALAKERVRTIETKFKLIQIMTGCALFSHSVKLPAWGFEQQEVTCAKGGTVPNSIWYVEENFHPAFGSDAETVNYRDPGFIGKFWELNKVMWATNAGLTESHAWDSRPPSWPILRRGINFWGKDHRQIYLMGNPVIWIASTIAVAIYVVIKGLAVLRWQRGYKDYSVINFKRFDYEVGTMVLGWAFHYFPFYLMQRQLFIHHYFPALYFAIIALCQVYDFVLYRFVALGLKKRPVIGQAVAVAFVGVSIFAFTLYAPLAYGNTWTQDQCNKVKLLSTWDWDCNTFLANYSDYNHYIPTIDAAVTTSAAGAPVAQVGENLGAPVEEQAYVTSEGQAPLGMDDQGRLILGRESAIEYRDENGNILDPAEIEAMKDQISFETRYETRTRLVDLANGHTALEGDDTEEKSYAGTIALGENPETSAVESVVGETPASAAVGDDVQKEMSVAAEAERTADAQPGAQEV